MDCLTGSIVISTRLEPQYPLAAPNDKPDKPEPHDQDDPGFGAHQRRKCLCPRHNAVHAVGKAVLARRQRSFVAPGEDQRFLGRRRNDGIIRLLDRKTAIVDIFGGIR